MSSLEDNIDSKLVNIENSLVNILDLVDYKKLCEEQLGYKLDQDNINSFIDTYNKYLRGLREVYDDQDDTFVNGGLVIFVTFLSAILLTLCTNSPLVFFSIIIFGFIIYLIMKSKNKKMCKRIKYKLKTEWKEYRSKLPYNEKVISIMEDIVYDYYGKFKYPSNFYKELYLRLKNNIMEDN